MFIVFNGMVDAIECKNNMMVSSINKIHITSLEIEKQHTQTQKKFQKEQIGFISKDGEINNIQKSMVQAMLWLTHVMDMMYSKGKPVIASDFIAKDKNTQDDWNNHDCRRKEHKYCKRQGYRSWLR